MSNTDAKHSIHTGTDIADIIGRDMESVRLQIKRTVSKAPFNSPTTPKLPLGEIPTFQLSGFVGLVFRYAYPQNPMSGEILRGVGMSEAEMSDEDCRQNIMSIFGLPTIQNINEAHTKALTQIDALTEEITDALSKITVLESANAELSGNVGKLEADKSDIVRELSELSNNVGTDKTDKAQAEFKLAKLSGLSEMSEVLKTDKKTLDTKLSEMSALLDKANADKAQAEFKLAKLSGLSESLRADKVTLEAKMLEMSENINQLTADKARVDRKSTRLNSSHVD